MNEQWPKDKMTREERAMLVSFIIMALIIVGGVASIIAIAINFIGKYW